VYWDRTLPIPKTDSSKMPELKKLEDRNLHNQQWTFSNEASGLSEIFTGSSPFGDGELEALMVFRKDLIFRKCQRHLRNMLPVLIKI
jgi:hypothetical protein